MGEQVFTFLLLFILHLTLHLTLKRMTASAAKVDKPSSNCWHATNCTQGEQCFVAHKTAMFGYAQCRRSCPAGWMCETRAAEGCGRAPLPVPLAPAPDGITELISPAVVCD